MIKLKNGQKIEYNKDLDLFFKDLLETIIKESRNAIEKNNAKNEQQETINEMFLKELMDNCIFVTHQLFEMAKINEELSKFMVTGFIFNSIMLTIAQLDNVSATKDNKDNEKKSIH